MAMTKARKRQINRLRGIFNRAEKKGFSWSEEYKQSILSASTQKQRHIKPIQLYKQATYKGKKGIVSGLEGLQERRQKKPKLTKREKWLMTPEGQEYWKQTQNILMNDMLPDEIFKKEIDEGKVIYDRIEKMINEYSEQEGAELLRKSLHYDIERFGLNNVLKGLGNAPDEAIKTAQTVIFYSDSMGKENKHRAFKAFFDIIRGTIPTAEESKEIGSYLDKMGGGFKVEDKDF